MKLLLPVLKPALKRLIVLGGIPLPIFHLKSLEQRFADGAFISCLPEIFGSLINPLREMDRVEYRQRARTWSPSSRGRSFSRHIND